MTIAVHRDSGDQALLFEGTVALVPIEELRHGIVGDGNIGMAIAIEVADRDPEALAGNVQADLR